MGPLSSEQNIRWKMPRIGGFSRIREKTQNLDKCRNSLETVSDWQVPLSAVRLTDADIEAAVDAYRSGWLSMGPRTQELESAFAEYAGAGNCLAVSSCTAGLHLAMSGAGLGPGDEAIVPSITFVASANAVAYTGARPAFAEIAAVDRPWLSVDSAERAISPATKAIVAVSYGGHPGEIDGLRELA